MIICAVQSRPVAGDIASNIVKHLKLIEVAIVQGGNLIFFPELSLTGYEPRQAKTLAIDDADPRLNAFQQRCNAHDIVIGVGVPLRVGAQVQSGMVWFAPNAPRRVYAKQQLHTDGMPYFVKGDSQLTLEVAGHTIAPAICYESLQMNHVDTTANLGADVYLASVAKPATRLAKAMLQHPTIARKYDMYVIMADCVEPSDDFVSAGQSSAWSINGELLAQMDSESEGGVMVDIVNV